MARSKKNRGKKSKPPKAGGKKGKKKYGLRLPEVPKSQRKSGRRRGTTAGQDGPKKKRAAPKRRFADPDDPNRLERTWDANYERAVKLHAEDPLAWWKGMTGKDYSFGRWLQTQRYNRSRGLLRPDREARLRKIHFVWNTIDAVWDLHFNALKKHMKKAGKLWWKGLPTTDPKLALWCDSQRRALSNGELDDERRELLEGIGFVWSPIDEQWEARFEELREFLKDKPSGRVGKDNAPRSLVFWAMTQRRKWLLGELAEERVQRLEEVGFSWDGRQARSDEIWEENFENLAAYHELTKDGNPGPEEDEDTFRWLVGQRRQWDEMPPERRSRLEALGVSRETPADQLARRIFFVPDWDDFFKKASAFKKKFGHMRISHDAEAAEFPGLAIFAGKLRSGSIDPDEEQSEKLDQLGFVWDLRSARREAFFDKRFAELEAYKKKHGDTNVSQLSKQYRALGQWVTRTRQTRDELTDEQRQRLEDLGIVWELKKEWMETQWEIRFAELLEYRKQHGDTLVPQECPEWYTLSRWVARMRQTRDTLSPERIARLEEVGFVWNAKVAERAATEEARYAELAAFVKANGHARVTRGSDPTGGPLNAWIVRQREKRKKGKMDPGFEQRLDALGFVW